jgi:hypothetical protein
LWHRSFSRGRKVEMAMRNRMAPNSCVLSESICTRSKVVIKFAAISRHFLFGHGVWDSQFVDLENGWPSLTEQFNRHCRDRHNEAGADAPYPKPLPSMIRSGGVSGFLFQSAVQIRKCRPIPRFFTPRQTLMPEFDQPPFYIDRTKLPGRPVS